MDWNNPEDRAALADRVGPTAYNAAHAAHVAATTVETVNGYGIRPVSTRFGRLFAVDGTADAYTTLEAARTHAAGLPTR